MRIPLAVDLQNRDTTTDKDARLLNCIVEGQGGRRKGDKALVVKRPALDRRYAVSTGHATAPNDVVGQALFSWTTAAGVATLAAIRGDTLDNAPSSA
jgi:hypothetical protein